jgi:hypothetical protein
MTTEQANALYNRQMDAARARAIEARREAVNEFWDSLGLTAADALRAARRLISRGARFPAPPPARGRGAQQA